MKALILTVSAGQGHNIVAAAIENKLKKSGAQTCVSDVYYSLNKFAGFALSRGYLFSVGALSKLYSKVYRKLEDREQNDRSFAVKMISAAKKSVSEQLEKFKPDVIICTHVFACIALKRAIEKNPFKGKIFGVVTDYTLHPYWEETTFIDYLVVADKNLIPACEKKGYKKEQILPFGIPVRESFEKRGDKSQAKAAVGLRDKPVVLVMGGSMGYGKIADTITRLDSITSCLQIICICGSNHALKRKIDSIKSPRKLISLGYVDNIDKYMDASDLMVSKAGGCSSSEAFAKGLPLVLTNPIPGQEERNSDFFVKSGAACAVNNFYTVDDVVYKILRNRKQWEELRKSADALGKPDATKELCEFIFSTFN